MKLEDFGDLSIANTLLMKGSVNDSTDGPPYL